MFVFVFIGSIGFARCWFSILYGMPVKVETSKNAGGIDPSEADTTIEEQPQRGTPLDGDCAGNKLEQNDSLSSWAVGEEYVPEEVGEGVEVGDEVIGDLNKLESFVIICLFILSLVLCCAMYVIL